MTMLLITRGLPASGKTTWAKAWVQEDPERRCRVNRDDLRLNLYGRPAPLTFKQEESITAAQSAAVRSLLALGRDVVVDDTHLRHKYVGAWYKIAAELGVAFELREEFLDVDVEECIRRDKERLFHPHGYVGEEVIRDMHRRFKSQKGDWQVPELVTTYKYEPPLDRPYAWMVDIDGTLAKMNGRGPFEWHRVGEDEPVPAVIDFVNRVVQTNAFVVLMSGRDECCREETEDWLDQHRIDYDRLHMRPQEDTRRDSVVKLELFQRHVADKWQIVGVLDDRDQVVQMWRSIGLPCFQVAPGAF